MDLVIRFLMFALQVYSLILLARAFVSWVPNIDPNNQLVRLLYDITEPVLRPIRAALPPMQGVDFSPLVALIGITLISWIVGSF
jgi:YggT family protein